LTTARVRDEDLPARAVARPLGETAGREERSGARAKKPGSVVVPTGARVDATVVSVDAQNLSARFARCDVDQEHVPRTRARKTTHRFAC
jgi:hypothetical protein